MDKYLESLVPKKEVNEQTYEPDEVEIEDPIEDVNDAVIDATGNEAVEEMADDVEDDAAEGDAAEDNVPEQDLKTEEVVEHEFPRIVNVSSIRVYSIPDRRGLARTISGNVELLGFIEDFAIITYVRPGFGPVRGYTDKANV